jgi:hypothetical protein
LDAPELTPTAAMIGQVKRWLVHSASSRVADQYLKPVAPEDKAVIDWIRRAFENEKTEADDLRDSPVYLIHPRPSGSMMVQLSSCPRFTVSSR